MKETRERSTAPRRRGRTDRRRPSRQRTPGDSPEGSGAVHQPPASKGAKGANGSPQASASNGVRLNKFLADRGVASRRKCDELIAAGKVMVDDRPIDQLGTRIDPARQKVEVDGWVLEPAVQHRYYLLHKPKGVICTNEEREARPRAIDLITDPRKGRIYTVGRLDEESEGLLILTNDGAFAQRVSHPRHGVPKTYRVQVRGAVERDKIDRIRRGVHLAEGRTGRVRVHVQRSTPAKSTLNVTLYEGKNREVRRIFARFGYVVTSLVRTRIGQLGDPKLRRGEWRTLTGREVRELLDLTARPADEVLDETEPRPAARGTRGARRSQGAGRSKGGQRRRSTRQGSSRGGRR